MGKPILIFASWAAILGFAGDDRPVSGAGSTVLLALVASLGTIYGLYLSRRQLARHPWLNVVVVVLTVGGLVLADVADVLLSGWPVAAALLAFVCGLVVWIVRPGRHHVGQSTRGDLGAPVPPLLGALARTATRLAIPTVVYVCLLRWPLDAEAPSWPGTAVGVCIVAGAFGGSVVFSLLSPRFPCAVALEPTSTEGILVLGGRGNRLWVVRIVEDGPLVERLMGADVGLSAWLCLLTGEEDKGSTRYSDWLNRLTPGFVHAVCVVPGEESQSLLASGGSEGAVHLWNVGTGQRVRALRDSGTTVTALCPVPLGHGTGLAVSDGKGVRVHDPATWNVRWRSTEGRFCNALVGTATASGRWVIVGDLRGAVVVHDADDGTVTNRWQAHDKAVSALMMLRLEGEDLVVSCGTDGRVACCPSLRMPTLASLRVPMFGVWEGPVGRSDGAFVAVLTFCSAG